MKTYSRLSRFFLAAAAAMTLVACGDDSGTGPSATTLVMLRNDANTPIVSVNISKCSDAEWGANRLNTGEQIAAGATRNWSVAPGCYDVRVGTATKNAYWYDRDVVAGDTLRLALSAAADVGEVTAPIGSAKALR
jgi:hypothetical protein